jgi:hypothetical protein
MVGRAWLHLVENLEQGQALLQLPARIQTVGDAQIQAVQVVLDPSPAAAADLAGRLLSRLAGPLGACVPLCACRRFYVRRRLKQLS